MSVSRCIIGRDQRQEALSYALLLARAERCGVPTSLDDPRTPVTSAGLRAACRYAEMRTADYWVRRAFWFRGWAVADVIADECAPIGRAC